jgi:hypothetical protein
LIKLTVSPESKFKVDFAAPAPPEGAKHFNHLFNSFSSDFLILKQSFPLIFAPSGGAGAKQKIKGAVRKY